jgi:multidrug resistance efflux pump
MTKKEIARVKATIQTAEKQLREHDAKRKFIEAAIASAQAMCSHPSSTSDGGSYGGPGFASDYCDVCGKRTG